MCDFRLSRLFISCSWLIKPKIKRQRGNNQKQNHAALKENLLKIDSSARKNYSYCVSNTERAISKTTTQQTSYRNNFQLWQTHLRNKSSLRKGYLMLSIITKSGSRSIHFLQEELLKNFDATCAYAGCSHQGKADVKGHCDGANHIKCQKALENTKSLGSFGSTKATESLREQVCCRASDSRLGKYSHDKSRINSVQRMCRQ